jgi:hypothetical protein
VHQHPLRLRQRLQASQYGVGALGAAIDDGNLRMMASGSWLKRRSPGLTAITTRCTRIRQQRGDRVFENRFVTD